MTDGQELVQFITAENGDDLIVSFYVAKPQDTISGRSIILMRDKKWEHLVADSDRGVKLCDENFPVDEEADNNFIERIWISNSVVEIETTHRKYELNLRNVDDCEVREAKMVFTRMNYDKRFQLTVD